MIDPWEGTPESIRLSEQRLCLAAQAPSRATALILVHSASGRRRDHRPSAITVLSIWEADGRNSFLRARYPGA